MPVSNYPAYKKAVVIHFWIILIVISLYFLESILVPLGFAALLSVLLNPVSVWLQRRGFSCLVSVIITVSVSVLLAMVLLYFLFTQLALFAESIPQLQQKFAALATEAQQWLAAKLNLRTPKEIGWLNNAFKESMAKSDQIVSQSVSAATGVAIALTLIPVYVFLLLLYRDLLIRFLMRVFIYGDPAKVNDILLETQSVIQTYVVGLLIETVIVAVLNSAGLLLLGVKYAILLGVLGALLNMVPYIGGIIATILAVVIALVSSDGLTIPLAVVGLYAAVQFLDNNVIVPQIVAGRVKINAIISIVAVIAGGELWGVAGMFLSIPFVAILKIIFDRVEALKPWGMLMGIEYPNDPSQQNATSSFWQQDTTFTIIPPNVNAPPPTDKPDQTS